MEIQYKFLCSDSIGEVFIFFVNNKIVSFMAANDGYVSEHLVAALSRAGVNLQERHTKLTAEELKQAKKWAGVK